MDHILQPDDSNTLAFNHYPILISFFRQYGLLELLDTLLPKKRHFNVSHGQCILLFLCDCLTNRTPLSLYPKLLAHTDIEMLFGPGVKAEHFNDCAMGETLDAIANFGEDKLFFLVMDHLRRQVGIKLSTLHADTTNFSVQGEYDDEGSTPTGLHITFGHAKDLRTDLKRWALLMITNAQGIPVAMKALDGNSSDKITIIEGMKSLQAALEGEGIEEKSTFVADSSFYTSANIATYDGTWISHAPDKLKEVRTYLQMDDVPFSPVSPKGYQVYGFDFSYAGVLQRWVLVLSSQMCNRQHKTLLKSQEKQLKQAKAGAYHLNAKHFSCEGDALKAAAELAVKYRLLKALEPVVTVNSVNKEGKRGRPKNDEKTQVFSICVTFEKNPVALDNASKELGKFMLATNDLSLTDEQVLDIYKEQQSVERGFRFLKDGRLRLTPVFLKKPARIVALSFIMCITLLVYAIIENQLREALTKANETIHIQNVGPADYCDNAKPTLLKVFTLFNGLSTFVLTTVSKDRMLIRSSLPKEVKKVLGLLGPLYVQAFERK